MTVILMSVGIAEAVVIFIFGTASISGSYILPAVVSGIFLLVNTLIQSYLLGKRGAGKTKKRQGRDSPNRHKRT